MRYLLLLLSLLIGNISFGQTDKHVIIPGTKCSIIPPDGFVLAKSFSGLQNVEIGASIMVNELVSAPYQTIADGFNEENLKNKGIVLISKQIVDFMGNKATLLNISQKANNGTTYLKNMLVFGTSEGTVMVNGIYPKEYRQYAEDIKKAVLSTVYDMSRNDNPLDAVSFTIDIKGTEFKFTNAVSGMLCFTVDGKIPTDNPTLFIAQSISKINSSNKKQYAEERLKKLPRGESILIKEVKEVFIDNLSGYEIVAEDKTSVNITELTYQVMLFDDKGNYYILVGKASNNHQANLQTFRKIAQSFKRK